jgi:hypothetical protein
MQTETNSSSSRSYYEVSVEGGDLITDHESTEIGYFSESEIAQMDIMKNQLERFPDIYARQEAAFAR